MRVDCYKRVLLGIQAGQIEPVDFGDETMNARTFDFRYKKAGSEKTVKAFFVGDGRDHLVHVPGDPEAKQDVNLIVEKLGQVILAHNLVVKRSDPIKPFRDRVANVPGLEAGDADVLADLFRAISPESFKGILGE